MNNTFSSQKISQTANLDGKLILRYYELELMASFLGIKSMNPTLTQKEIAKELGYSVSSLKRYRQGILMLSPYRISSKSNNKT